MLKINELARLHLGVKGENESRTIEIDMSAWAQLYPNATVEILHKRYGDQTKALTGATYDNDTMILSWTPTDYDTFYEGYGVAEIRMVESDVVKKTKDLIVTAVCPSVIDGSGTVVASDYQAFLNSVLTYKNQANASRMEAENAAEDAEAWAKGTRDGEDVGDTDPAYHNNAKYYAEDAAESAGDAADAQEAAEDAQEAAETAKGLAEDAQEAAETAKAAAEAALQKYPYVDTVTGNWMLWDPETSTWVNTGIHAKGDTGEVPNISVGTVTTLMPGEQATVTRRAGSPDTAPIFDFAIPKGDTGTAENIYGNTIDMSENDTTKVATAIGTKADKVTGGTENNFAALDANGNLKDSGHKHSDYLTAHQDISGKADKVAGATSGNFAGLDANGNLTDSGSKASDFLTPSNIYNGTDKTQSGYALDARQGKILSDSANALRKGLVHVAKLSSGDWILSSGDDAAIGDALSVNGTLGVATAAITGGSTVLVKNTNWEEVSGGVINKIIADKANKVSGATSGNFAELDANGNLTDSGHKHSDYLTAHQDISGKVNAGAYAIVSEGDTHDAITSGQYVYVKNNSTLADGLYTASSNIAANGTLSSSNVSAVTGGGMNVLGGQISTLNSNITPLIGNTKWADWTELTPQNSEKWNGSYYCKIGKITFLQISVKALTANTNTNILSLPDGYKPLFAIEFDGFGGLAYLNHAHFRITNNGTVSVYSADSYATGFISFPSL